MDSKKKTMDQGFGMVKNPKNDRLTGEDVHSGETIRMDKDGLYDVDGYFSESEADQTYELAGRQRKKKTVTHKSGGKENHVKEASVSQSVPPKLITHSLQDERSTLQETVNKVRSRYAWMRNPRIGRRTGVDVLQGKSIRRDSDGFENFSDYLSESEAESYISFRSNVHSRTGVSSKMASQSSPESAASSDEPTATDDAEKAAEKSRVQVSGIESSRSVHTFNDASQKSLSKFAWMKNPRIGKRTGVDVLLGKCIRKDADGFENFSDYMSESEAESYISFSQPSQVPPRVSVSSRKSSRMSTRSAAPAEENTEAQAAVNRDPGASMTGSASSRRTSRRGVRLSSDRMSAMVSSSGDVIGEPQDDSSESGDNVAEPEDMTEPEENIVEPEDKLEEPEDKFDEQEDNSAEHEGNSPEPEDNSSDREDSSPEPGDDDPGPGGTDVMCDNEQIDGDEAHGVSSGDQMNENEDKAAEEKEIYNETFTRVSVVQQEEGPDDTEGSVESEEEQQEQEEEEDQQEEQQVEQQQQKEEELEEQNEEEATVREDEKSDGIAASQPCQTTGIEVGGNLSGSITKRELSSTAGATVSFNRTKKRLSYSALELSDKAQKQRKDRIVDANEELSQEGVAIGEGTAKDTISPVVRNKKQNSVPTRKSETRNVTPSLAPSPAPASVTVDTVDKPEQEEGFFLSLAVPHSRPIDDNIDSDVDSIVIVEDDRGPKVVKENKRESKSKKSVETRRVTAAVTAHSQSLRQDASISSRHLSGKNSAKEKASNKKGQKKSKLNSQSERKPVRKVSKRTSVLNKRRTVHVLPDVSSDEDSTADEQKEEQLSFTERTSATSTGKRSVKGSKMKATPQAIDFETEQCDIHMAEVDVDISVTGVGTSNTPVTMNAETESKDSSSVRPRKRKLRGVSQSSASETELKLPDKVRRSSSESTSKTSSHSDSDGHTASRKKSSSHSDSDGHTASRKKSSSHSDSDTASRNKTSSHSDSEGHTASRKKSSSHSDSDGHTANRKKSSSHSDSDSHTASRNKTRSQKRKTRKSEAVSAATTPEPSSFTEAPTTFASGVSFRVSRRSERLEDISSGSVGHVPVVSGSATTELTPCIWKNKPRKSKGRRVTICQNLNLEHEISAASDHEDIDSALPSVSSTPLHIHETTNTCNSPADVLGTKRLIIPDSFETGLRRSRRTRLPPVAAYKGEHVLMDYSDPTGPVIVGVKPSLEVQHLKREAEKRQKRMLRNAIKKATKISPDQWRDRKLSIHTSLPADVTLSPRKEVKVVNPETQEEAEVSCIVKKEMCGAVGPSLKTPQKEDPYLIAVHLDEPIYSNGQLVLKSRAVKPKQLVIENAVTFHITYGKLLVTIHESSAVLETGDTFSVPCGNTYSLENLRAEKASLFYYVHKKLPK